MGTSPSERAEMSTHKPELVNKAIEILVRKYQDKTGLPALGSLVRIEDETVLLVSDIPSIPGSYLGILIEENDNIETPEGLFSKDFNRHARIVFSKESVIKFSRWMSDPEALKKDYEETMGENLEDAVEREISRMKKEGPIDN